jgi:hypothetical protein
MRIYLKHIRHYFLTVDTNGARKHHMLEVFKDYNLFEVNPILDIGKCKSGATGFSKMIDLGLRNQDRSLPFQPFVLYEDDCSMYRPYPEYIEIPDDADLCYIGLSQCSMDNQRCCYKSFYKVINSDIIRIYNMLASHGIIVCSASGALAIQKAMLEAYYKNTVWDIFVSYIQPYYNVYALKSPLVFQDAKYGGAQSETWFSIKSDVDSLIPEHYINKTNDSIIMNCQSPVIIEKETDMLTEQVEVLGEQVEVLGERIELLGEDTGLIFIQDDNAQVILTKEPELIMESDMTHLELDEFAEILDENEQLNHKE